jgi:GDP-4-dehydro-6-deoxy-D-mannose reductase
MARCLITGCEGFVGSHMADMLVGMGHIVYGSTYADTHNIDHLKGKITMLHCSLTEAASVQRTVGKAKPDYVFHLAAQSYPTVSFKAPRLTLDANVTGTLNLLESIRRLAPKARVAVTSSSAVYGVRTAEEMPINEKTGFRPTSFYAVSKVGQEMLSYLYHEVYHLNTIIVRPFSMTGPRKTGDACSDFTKGIIEIEKGRRKYLGIGRLDTIRDVTDGRDAVKAFWTIINKGEIGEVYNLCSNNRLSMSEILQKAIAFSGFNVKVKQQQSKMRVYDDPIYIGDNSKLRALGWKPTIPIDKTVRDDLEYWRSQL